jgi:hypothetical protein
LEEDEKYDYRDSDYEDDNEIDKDDDSEMEL